MTALHARLAMAVTALDRKESTKPGHNRYALPQYLAAVANIVADVERGASVRAAVRAAFTGRVLVAVLRGIGEPRLTDDERQADRYGSGVYIPVVPE